VTEHKHEWVSFEVLELGDHVMVVQECICGRVRMVEAIEHEQ
jgi:hypothetical protein